MQVKGGKEVTLTPGQTFYEGRDDVHTVGRNAGSTKPAKFVVFLVKEEGTPVLIPGKLRQSLSMRLFLHIHKSGLNLGLHRSGCGP